MKIIRPVQVVSDAQMTSSVPDTPPAWAAGAAYAKGNHVQDPAAHREYESLQANNTGHPLSDAAWWLDLGPTNRWRMFDQSNSSQTVVDESLQVDLLISSRVNAIALLNCEATEARITATVGTTQVYDDTFAMTSTSGIDDWHAYFFEPIDRRPDLIVADLPLYSNMAVRVLLTRPGGAVKVGTFVIGQTRDLGVTEIGMSAGIVDYSRKGADDFGNVMLIERAFAKKLDARVLVQNNEVDRVVSELSKLRATPVVWVADDRFVTAGIYGFYRNFSVTFAYPGQSLCLLEVEGLT